MKNILLIFSILCVFVIHLSAQKITPKEKDGLYGFKKGGSLVIDFQYDSIRDDYDRGYYVKKAGNWGLISLDGKEVIPCQYQKLNREYKFFHAVLDNKHGILDSTGVVLLEFIYDNIDHVDEDLSALVKYHGQWCMYQYGIYDYLEEHFVFHRPQVMPRFPGCENVEGSDQDKRNCAEKKMLDFIFPNLSYPSDALKNHFQGIVIIRFVVTPDGELVDLKVLRDIGGGCAEEAMKMIRKMPRWIPGMQEGKQVSSQFVLPVKFVLK